MRSPSAALAEASARSIGRPLLVPVPEWASLGSLVGVGPPILRNLESCHPLLCCGGGFMGARPLEGMQPVAILPHSEPPSLARRADAL